MRGINVSRHLIVHSWSHRDILKMQIWAKYEIMLVRYQLENILMITALQYFE